MGYAFKIIKNDVSEQKISVIYIKQKATKPIDEYPPVVIDYAQLDFSNFECLVSSIIKCGIHIAEDNEKYDNILKENMPDTILKKSNSLDDILNKVVVLEKSDIIKDIRRLKKVDL